MNDLRGRRILVWGFGRHGGGLAAGRFLAAAGAEVSVLDAQPAKRLGADADAALAAGWTWHVGDISHPIVRRVDAIVASPAIPPRAYETAPGAASTRNAAVADLPPIWSPESLFFAAHRGPRLAVTGTKGKSTTSTIAARLLGWQVAGNSHEPLLSALARLGPDTPLVCELSSFQLWYLRDVRPRFPVAIVSTLAIDHLDWHLTPEHYHAAKLALLSWCDAAAVADECLARIPDGCRPLPRVTCDGEAQGDAFRDSDGRILATRGDLDLLGAHNARNAALALAAARALGVADSDLAPRLRQVRGLPHRLSLVHELRHWRFLDDSIATTPESAMAALDAVTGPLAVILGGSDKGAEFAVLARAVAARGARPVLIGQTADRIAAALAGVGLTSDRAASLDLAVARAVDLLPYGGTILLSPACASLDMFRSFEDRGERFAAAARRVVA